MKIIRTITIQPINILGCIEPVYLIPSARGFYIEPDLISYKTINILLNKK